MSTPRPPYPAAFRQQFVELVHSGRSPGELAQEFEPSAQTTHTWVKQAEIPDQLQVADITYVPAEGAFFYFLGLNWLSDTSSPKHCFIRPAPRAAVRKFTIHYNGGNRADPQAFGSMGNSHVLHIQDLHIAARTGHLVHLLYNVVAGRATRAEDLNYPFRAHDVSSFKYRPDKPPALCF